jgi:hypothetical protein
MRYQVKERYRHNKHAVIDTSLVLGWVLCSTPSLKRAHKIADALNTVEKLSLSEDGVRVVPRVDTVWQIDPKGIMNRPPAMWGADPTHGHGAQRSMPRAMYQICLSSARRKQPLKV